MWSAKWSWRRSHCPWIINYFIFSRKNWFIISNGTPSILITHCISDIEIDIFWHPLPLFCSSETAPACKIETELRPSFWKHPAQKWQSFIIPLFCHYHVSGGPQLVISAKMMGELNISFPVFLLSQLKLDCLRWEKKNTINKKNKAFILHVLLLRCSVFFWGGFVCLVWFLGHTWRCSWVTVSLLKHLSWQPWGYPMGCHMQSKCRTTVLSLRP